MSNQKNEESDEILLFTLRQASQVWKLWTAHFNLCLLIQVECDIPDDCTQVGQFDTELLVRPAFVKDRFLSSAAMLSEKVVLISFSLFHTSG